MIANVLIFATAVSLSGELGVRLARNFDRLEEDKYRPENVFLTMEQSWGWPGDTEGRTILALVMDSKTTGRTPRYLDAILARLPEKLNARGYMGPVFEGVVNEQQISGNGWMLRGLCEYWLWKKDSRALGWIRGIADGLFLPAADDFADYPVDPAARDKGKGGASGHTVGRIGRWELSTDIGCYVIGIDGLIQARQVLGDARYDRAIDNAIGRYLAIDQVAIKAQAHATLTGIRALLRFGDKYLAEAEERFRRYCGNCMTEAFANANWFMRFDQFTEPCAIVDSYMVALQLWDLTGKVAYLEMADKIYWNALCRAQRRNGGFGLENCPGKAAGTPELVVHEPEAHWCCTMRGAEGLASAAAYSARVRGNRVLLAQYHAGTHEVETTAGRFKFREETKYPFDGKVKVTVLEAPSSEMCLSFFAPSYLDTDLPRKDGFVDVRRVFRPGDAHCVEFRIKERSEPPQNANNLCAGWTRRFRGPLLLAKDGEFVYHLMNPEIWEKGSGARRVLLDSQNAGCSQPSPSK